MITFKRLLHFKIERLKLWCEFLIKLPYHVLFHQMNPWSDDGYQGWTIKGFILCSCGHCIDMGINYGMHCEDCYDIAHELNDRRVQRLGWRIC